MLSEAEDGYQGGRNVVVIGRKGGREGSLSKDSRISAPQDMAEGQKIRIEDMYR